MAMDSAYNKNTPYSKLSQKEKDKIKNTAAAVLSKMAEKPKPKPTRVGPLAKSTAKPKPTPTRTLPTLAEFKQSAAYKAGVTYKEYLDMARAQGAK